MSKLIKTLFIMAISATVAMPIPAQTMHELWAEMPDSITVYLDSDMRRQMLDIADMGLVSPIKNKLAQQSSIDSIAADYIRVSMSASKRLEMGLIKTEDGDTCIIMLSTFIGDKISETDVSLFNCKWEKIGNACISPDLCLADSVSEASDEDDTILVTVEARLSMPDSLVLVPKVFRGNPVSYLATKKVKISSLKIK